MNRVTCHAHLSPSSPKTGDTSDPCLTFNAVLRTDWLLDRESTTPLPTTRTPELGESGRTTSRDNLTRPIQTAHTSKR